MQPIRKQSKTRSRLEKNELNKPNKDFNRFEDTNPKQIQNTIANNRAKDSGVLDTERVRRSNILRTQVITFAGTTQLSFDITHWWCNRANCIAKPTQYRYVIQVNKHHQNLNLGKSIPINLILWTKPTLTQNRATLG